MSAPLESAVDTATGMKLMMERSPERREALTRQAIEDFKLYMKGIERMYVLIHQVSMPKMIVYSDGRTEFEHSDWTKEQLAEIDKLAAEYAAGFPWEQYGLQRPTTTLP